MWWNHYAWSGEYWPMPWMFFGPVMMIIFFVACAAVLFFMMRGAMFHRGHAGAAGMMSCCETGLGPSLERATAQDARKRESGTTMDPRPSTNTGRRRFGAWNASRASSRNLSTIYAWRRTRPSLTNSSPSVAPRRRRRNTDAARTCAGWPGQDEDAYGNAKRCAQHKRPQFAQSSAARSFQTARPCTIRPNAMISVAVCSGRKDVKPDRRRNQAERKAGQARDQRACECRKKKNRDFEGKSIHVLAPRKASSA